MDNNQPPGSFLSPHQKKVVGAALTGLAVALLILMVLGSFVAVGKLLAVFSSVIWPLAVAFILTVLLKPIVIHIRKTTRLPRTASIILLYLLVILLLTGIALLVVPIIVGQAISLFESIPIIYEKVVVLLHKHQAGMMALVENNINIESLKEYNEQIMAVIKNLLSASGGALKFFGHGVVGAFAWSVSFAIIPVYLFFFLQFENNDSPKIANLLSFLKKDYREDVEFLVKEFVGMIVAFFRGQILIALIMGILMGIGFTLCGLKSGFFIGLTLGMLNLIPYLGSILGVAIALPLAYFQPEGGFQTLAWVVTIMILVQLLEGWILTPKIMGNQTGLHPAAIIFSVFFWGIALGGLTGMILAIPLSAFFVTFWRLAKAKYIPKLMGLTEAPLEESFSETDAS